MTDNKLSVDDFILYKSGNQVQLGKVVAQLEDAQVLVEQYDDTLQPIGDEDCLTHDRVVCNFFDKPMLGFVYGRNFTQAPKKSRLDGHEVFFYAPKEYTEEGKELDTTAYIDALQRAFDLIEPIRSSFCDKQYEVHIKEGETHKSSFKKSKKDFDGSIELEIKYAVPETLVNALVTSFSQQLWKTSTRESRSDFLKAFSEDLVFERLDQSTFVEKFMLFINEDAKQELEMEDEIVCKLLAKEIKRVKCLSLKELKLLSEVNGEDYIVNQLLPEVINSVRLKGGARINPLTSTTAVKKFSTELTSYIVNQRADSHFEPILQMFYD